MWTERGQSWIGGGCDDELSGGLPEPLTIPGSCMYMFVAIIYAPAPVVGCSIACTSPDLSRLCRVACLDVKEVAGSVSSGLGYNGDIGGMWLCPGVEFELWGTL